MAITNFSFTTSPTVNTTMFPVETNNETVVSREFLEQLELEVFLQRHIPVTVYLIMLALVGTVGNIHAILVYSLRYNPSNYRTFVVWLGFIDLAACCMSIPFEVYDIRNGFTFESDATCKFFRFLNHLVSSGSGFLLGVIAIERFRKVCRPFSRQLNEKESKMACVITVVVSSLLSLPSFILYGPTMKETPYPGVMGSDCTVLRQYKKSIFFKLYNGVLIFLVTSVFIICVVVYIMVGRVLYKSTKFRKSAQVVGMKKCGSTSSSSNLRNGVSMNQEPSVAKEEESSTNETNSKVSRSVSVSDGTVKKRKKFDRMKRITMMFLVATAVSYIGYLPNLILGYMKAFNGKVYNEASDVLGPFNSILLRGYFINNATNPVVYCFLDDRFRRECKNLYRKFNQVLCEKFACGKK